MIKRIQNFTCYVFTVYIYVYINAHVYIKENMLDLYIKCLYFYKFYTSINIYI